MNSKTPTTFRTKLRQTTQSQERTNLKLAKLEAEIASARRDLHTAWDARGYTDAVVLAASAKINALCNEYQRLLHGPGRRPKP